MMTIMSQQTQDTDKVKSKDAFFVSCVSGDNEALAFGKDSKKG